MKSFTILVFDSGAGGLSISTAVSQYFKKQGIGLHLVYLADYEGFPYSLLSEEEVTKRVLLFIQQHLHRAPAEYLPDLIILACNTASTLALSDLRMRVNIPVVGVVPAIKPAAQLSQTQVIGVLATPVTIAGGYLDQLNSEFAQNVEVILKGSAELVELSEEYIVRLSQSPQIHGVHPSQSSSGDLLHQLHRRIYQQISEDVDWMLHQKQGATLDTLVLACTHFPLLQDIFVEYFQDQGLLIQCIDSSHAIAKRSEYLLLKNQPQSSQAVNKKSEPSLGSRQRFSVIPPKRENKIYFEKYNSYQLFLSQFSD